MPSCLFFLVVVLFRFVSNVSYVIGWRGDETVRELPRRLPGALGRTSARRCLRAGIRIGVTGAFIRARLEPGRCTGSYPFRLSVVSNPPVGDGVAT